MTTSSRNTTSDLTRELSPGVRRWTLALGATTLVQGLWAFGWPADFYGDFPVPGAQWVSALGPFNDHLARDFGAAMLGIGAIAVVAGLSDSRSAVRATMIGAIVFGIPHLVFHLTTFGEFSGPSIATQISALVFFVALPLRLLAALRHDSNTKGTIT